MPNKQSPKGVGVVHDIPFAPIHLPFKINVFEVQNNLGHDLNPFF